MYNHWKSAKLIAKRGQSTTSNTRGNGTRLSDSTGSIALGKEANTDPTFAEAG
jgi:hypothetical protein